MKFEDVLLVLVVLFLLYFFMSNCGCRVEGFDKQYNFVYPKCSYASRDHPSMECLSGKNRAIYYTTNPEAFSAFNGTTKVSPLTVHTDYKIPTPSPGNEDICLDILTTDAVRSSDDFHSKYGFKKGACDPRNGVDATTREIDDKSQTYGNVLHTGYVDVSAFTLGRSIPYTVNKKTQGGTSGACNKLKIHSCEAIFPEDFNYSTSLNKTGNTVEENKKLCNNSINNRGYNCFVPEGPDYPKDTPICIAQDEKCNFTPAECRETLCDGHGTCEEVNKDGDIFYRCNCDTDWSGENCGTRTCAIEGGMCDVLRSGDCCHGLKCKSAGGGAGGMSFGNCVKK